MIPAAPLLRNPYGLTLLLQCPKSLSAPGRGAIRVLTSELPEQHAKSPQVDSEERNICRLGAELPR